MILVLPERQPRDLSDLISYTREQARGHGMTIKTFRAAKAKVAGEPWGRPIQFLAPRDALQLYKSLHRTVAIVLSFTQVYVRRDPSRHPVVRRKASTLAEFVAHKAVYGLVRGKTSVPGYLDRFIAWQAAVKCAGEDDPRVLPLHVFEAGGPWSELATSEGRAAFDSQFGGGASRTDLEQRMWDRASRAAYHGRERLTVAGHTLAAGMHWDVNIDSAKARLTTAHEVWQLRRRAGYVNVYPDGHVGKAGRSTARCVWTAPVLSEKKNAPQLRGI